MFKIVTDSTADLPAEYLQEHDLGCINLSYIMDGVTYGQGQELPEKEFYALMRNGKMPTTSQVNPEEAKNHFLKYLKENKEILCIAFSSGLSGTYNSMRVAAEEIMEEQPDCRIIVIDSLCASGVWENIRELHVDDEGHLIVIGKVRGRKKACS